MKIGLVLGAGGVMGGAWITGGLEALARETGWDPGSADHVVGTSAGSMMGTLVASGIPPWFMVAHSGGRNFDGVTGADGRPAASADRSAGARFRPARAVPRLLLGSPELAANALRGGPAGAYRLLLSLGPRGMISTEPLKEIVRRVMPEGWSPHPNLWLVATDYGTGERVVFGREGSPPAELADAVAASCAVPSFYQPVRIGRRHYIDGGVNSVSNLDLLAGLDLDLVICLNPMSSRYQPRGFRPLPRLQALVRAGAGRRLGHEARLVRESGTRVALIQPTVPDLRMMGTNWLSSRKRHAVIELAIETVGKQLQAPEMRKLLAGLPPGEPYRVKEPTDIPMEAWTEIVGVAGAASRRRSA